MGVSILGNGGVAAAFAISVLSCIATGKEVNDPPLKRRPTTDTATVELMNNKPENGPATSGSPAKSSVTNLESCWRPPTVIDRVATVTPCWFLMVSVIAAIESFGLTIAIPVFVPDRGSKLTTI